MSEIKIQPATLNAEPFADRLRAMYAASPERDMAAEVGVHRFVYHDPEADARVTVFVAVGDVPATGDGLAWGNQIRSYVTSPFTRAVDHRTGAETEDVEAVFAGATDWLAVPA